MTKKTRIEPALLSPIEQKQRKLTKKEREELENQLHEALSSVADSIKAGRIQAPWWRQVD